MMVGIRYVDGPHSARSLFPVPDGDTGTNLNLTLRPLADALRALGDTSLSDTDSPDISAFMTRMLAEGELSLARTQIRNFGGIVQVVVASDMLKLHVHPDTPEAVLTYAARWGTIDATKAEGMRAQHRRMRQSRDNPVGTPTGTAGIA